MKKSSVEVAYASRMKPGDLYAGNVNPAAPTRPVQEFATAHRLTDVTPYTDDEGRRMLNLRAGVFPLTPVPAAAQVLLIREGEVTPDQVTRYLAQHGVPKRLPAGAGSPEDVTGGILLTPAQLRAWAGLGRDLTAAELARLTRCIPESSIPAAVGTIVAEALGLAGEDGD